MHASYASLRPCMRRKNASISGILLTVDASKDNGLLVLILWDTDEWVWVRGDADKLQTMPVDVHSLLHGVKSGLKSPLDRQLHPIVSPEEGTGQVVALRVFVDGSAVEIFTSSGKAASTRLYGYAGRSLYGVCSGGDSSVSGALWPMTSCWKEL